MLHDVALLRFIMISITRAYYIYIISVFMILSLHCKYFIKPFFSTNQFKKYKREYDEISSRSWLGFAPHEISAISIGKRLNIRYFCSDRQIPKIVLSNIGIMVPIK